MVEGDSFLASWAGLVRFLKQQNVDNRDMKGAIGQKKAHKEKKYGQVAAFQLCLNNFRLWL